MSRHSQLLQNAIRMQAVAAANLRSHPKIGTISGYDPNKQAVKVLLQPEGNETGWIPLGSLWVGNGWGLVCAPNLGSQVEVTFVDGNDESGSANLRFFSNVEQGPAAPGGEFWIVHAKGQRFQLENDGTVLLTDGQGAAITLNGDGTISITATQTTISGPVTFTDNVQVDKTLTATTDVVGGGKSLKTHPHLPGSYVAGATAVTGNSGTPV